MFTGLAAGMGEISALRRSGSEMRLVVRPLFRMDDIQPGESVAVNGACLTVETFGSGDFTAYASEETVSRTNLGGLGRGGLVNLERALSLGARLGGHIVSGHVDCLAEVVSVSRAGQSTVFRLRFPEEYAGQVIPKGSIALDGVSLTINNCGTDFLEVNVIPATLEATTLRAWKPGAKVNMETDVLGKYVQRALSLTGKAGGAEKESRVSMEFLREHGF